MLYCVLKSNVQLGRKSTGPERKAEPAGSHPDCSLLLFLLVTKIKLDSWGAASSLCPVGDPGFTFEGSLILGGKICCGVEKHAYNPRFYFHLVDFWLCRKIEKSGDGGNGRLPGLSCACSELLASFADDEAGTRCAGSSRFCSGELRSSGHCDLAVCPHHCCDLNSSDHFCSTVV